MHICFVSNFRPFFSSLALICLSLGKLTTNYILNTDLDFFHSFASFWKKICLSQDSFLSSKDANTIHKMLDVASVYSVQSQNQIPQNLSCLLVSQRKIGN